MSRADFERGYEQAKKDALKVCQDELDRINGMPVIVNDWTRRPSALLRCIGALSCPQAPEVEPTKPVCSTCNDTHRMSFGERDDVSCTRCPTPCERCRRPFGAPYCETTPCACSCHAKPAPSAVDIDTSDEAAWGRLYAAGNSGDATAGDYLAAVKPILDALRARAEKAEAERTAWVKNYKTVADAVARESTSADDLARQARETRAERDALAKQVAELEERAGNAGAHRDALRAQLAELQAERIPTRLADALKAWRALSERERDMAAFVLMNGTGMTGLTVARDLLRAAADETTKEKP